MENYILMPIKGADKQISALVNRSFFIFSARNDLNILKFWHFKN
jgi:hypothetical protein